MLADIATRKVARRHHSHLVLLLPLFAAARAHAVEPNDVHYSALQWNLRALGMQDAWEITTGRPDVVVAVVDSGVAPQHPDLEGRLLQGYDFISEPQLAGDGDGWDSDPTDTMANPDARIYHGSHVAGIIGASSNNGRGIAGVDWQCKILPVRAIPGASNEGSDTDLAAAIRWAAGLAIEGVPINEHPADVINLSFGARGQSQVLDTAVVQAIDAGSIVVAAAGNGGANIDDFYPAAIPGVIAVGATTYSGERAAYSNYGSGVDVMAPGGDLRDWLPDTYMGEKWQTGVLSTSYYYGRQRYSYRMFDGTSVAAPHVSGTIALVLALEPELDAEEVLALLQATSAPVKGCAGDCGSGIVDTRAALEAVSGAVFGKGGALRYRGSGCQMAAESNNASLVWIWLLLVAMAVRSAARWTLVAVMAGCLAVSGAGCTGTVDAVGLDDDGGVGVRGEAAATTDQGIQDSVSVDWRNTEPTPEGPGDLCRAGECGGDTVCVEGICRQACEQTQPGCNARSSECRADESCLQIIGLQQACVPADAQLGEPCGGEVLCVGGTVCVKVDGKDARCIKLSDNSRCDDDETLETTVQGCEVCVH